MPHEQKDRILTARIVTMDYGDSISHQEIEQLIGARKNSSKYNFIINKSKKKLLESGKMIESVRGYGYRVVEPDYYSRKAVSQVSSAGRRIASGAKILQFAPTAHMTEDGRTVHRRLSDRMALLNAAMHGATAEVKVLCSTRHPFLPQNTQAT